MSSIEPQAYSKNIPALDGEEAKTEKLNYAVQCTNVDFGMLDAPNQFNSKIINPLRDMIMASLKKDRGLRGGKDSRQRYTVALIVTAERDLDTVQ
jgi:hypothetical protein